MATGFPHRTNPDGTIGSICPHCYSTIGNAYWEAELERLESHHICDPMQLAYFEEVRRLGAKRKPGLELLQKSTPIKRVG